MKIDDAYRHALMRLNAAAHYYQEFGDTEITRKSIDMLSFHVVEQIRTMNETGMLKILGLPDA